MSARSKILSLTALLAVLAVAGLWWLNRTRPSSSPAKAPLAQNAAPAVTAAPATLLPAVPAPSVAAAPTATASPVPSQPVVAAPASVAPAVAAAPTPATPAPIAAPTAPPNELAATARMYAAHAPLRTPEVADPDSAANKRILGTMVAKALTQPATPPPSVSSSKR